MQITIATDKTVADLKQAIAEKSDVPADRQRLIYSGASSIPSAQAATHTDSNVSYVPLLGLTHPTRLPPLNADVALPHSRPAQAEC